MLAQLDYYNPLPPSGESIKMKNTPVVVNETQVTPFKYWNEGIQEGISCNNELYTHFHAYSIYDRLKAYDVAYEQNDRGIDVCITVSKTHYIIWLSLRSLARMTDHDLSSVA